MPEIKPIRLYSKSSVSVDWNCPRSYYYNYCEEGTGVVQSNTGLELFIGVALHDSLAAIALSHLAGQPVDIDLIATTAYKQLSDGLQPVPDESGKLPYVDQDFVKEQSTLVEGIIRGFYKHVWPRLLASYPTIRLVEQAMVYQHDGIGLMAKPDLVLQDKSGLNWYIEYKSTSSKKDTWIKSWETAIQAHSTIRAIEKFLGEPVAGMLVQGLYKGYESYGKQGSPFCYCYKSSGRPPFTKDMFSYDYKPGFKRYPIWELEGGVKKWVEGMPTAVLVEQFPQTPPIFINDSLIDAFFRQRAVRESQVAKAQALLTLDNIHPDSKQQIFDAFFPQRFDKCWQPWDTPCQYTKLCHQNSDSPLENGYVKRTEDHQKVFRDLLENEVTDVS